MDTPNVLIVDDKPENLLLLENLLEGSGVGVVKALSGAEALELVCRYELALILLDVIMPEMDGFETAERLRSQERSRHIPIIFITAIGRDRKHVFKGYRSGAVDYMVKPLDREILKSKVGVFLELYRQKKALEEMNEEILGSREVLCRINDELEKKVEERTVGLIRAKEEAEFANNAKSEFLANISHELRTPLHGVLSFAQLGAARIDTLSKEKTLHYFNRISRSGERLLVLLNDLLDLAKLEAGRVDYQMKKENLRQIIGGGIGEFDSVVKEKRLSLEIVEPEVSTEVVCDNYKIGQVVRNLLSNAIKFTPEQKKITISFKDGCIESPRSSLSALHVLIADQGMGIPNDELDSIFDKFVQSSKTTTGTGGTGLGLAICHEIVKAHHGRIWAENSVEGAVFNFTLPYG
ncbi:MAG: response regulator [Proteobacteria bacterium]|nr:response regulator [Pseudomonadota bacterium]